MILYILSNGLKIQKCFGLGDSQDAVSILDFTASLLSCVVSLGLNCWNIRHTLAQISIKIYTNSKIILERSAVLNSLSLSLVEIIEIEASPNKGHLEI